jgi:hypothetical protein
MAAKSKEQVQQIEGEETCGWQKRCREGNLLDTGVAHADIGIVNSFRINAELL